MDLIYACYFVSSNGNGRIDIYEDGGNRGNQTANVDFPNFTVNNWYEVRVVLKTQGADYFLRPLGDDTWDLIYSSNHSSETDLRVGMAYYGSGTAITDDWVVGSGNALQTTDLCVGEYTYIVTDSVGCTGTTTVNVGASDSIVPTVICNTFDLQLDVCLLYTSPSPRDS